MTNRCVKYTTLNVTPPPPPLYEIRRRRQTFDAKKKNLAGAKFHKGGGDVKGCMFITGVGHSA